MRFFISSKKGITDEIFYFLEKAHNRWGQLFRQLWTRLHHVLICVAQTVNTYIFYVLWLCRISLDCVLVKQLKGNSDWCTRKQSETAASVTDFSSTTVKNHIFKEILAQNWTRTIVLIVIGVYLYHFSE